MSLDSDQTIHRDFKKQPFRFRRCFGTKQSQDTTLSNHHRQVLIDKLQITSDRFKHEDSVYEPESLQISKLEPSVIRQKVEKIVTDGQQIHTDVPGAVQEKSSNVVSHLEGTTEICHEGGSLSFSENEGF